MWPVAWASDRRAQGRKVAEQWSVLGEHWPTSHSVVQGMGAATQPHLFLSCTSYSDASFGARSLIAHFLQVGGVYSYDCSFGHVPNVELMKFIAMATFGSYLSTCPEPEPGNLGLTVYHRAFLLYSFLRSGEALNPEYYCGEGQAGAGVGTGSGEWTLR